MARRKKKRSKSKKGLWSKKSEFVRLDGSKVSMDSTWEVACAEKLDELNIKWVRDPEMKLQYRTQRLRLRNYIPDFYLPDHDIYLEIKGYWTDSARWKMRDVCSRYPGKIKIIESLEEIAGLSEPILPSTGSLSFRELLD